VASIVCHYWH